jgi:iron complex outermembrane receptor protein
LLVAAVLSPGADDLRAQSGGGVVTGVVRDGQGAPLAAAQIYLSGAGREVRTDDAGRFVLREVAAGPHVLQVALVGYSPARREFEVSRSGAPVELEITLEATPFSLPGILVTGTAGSKDPLLVAQATTQLSGRALERELGGTLAQTLKSQPGIAMRSMGPAAAMPVMRGLTGDRILILQDGQRAGDLAGSADDHGVTIDPLVAQRVEVVRGPATLLYGNNALGGVVNVISGDIPTHLPARAEYTVSAQSESAYPGASANSRVTLPLGGAWALSMRTGGRRTSNMRIPEDPVLGTRLNNTHLRNFSGSAGLGYVGEQSTAGAALKAYGFAYGLPVPPGLPPVSLRGDRYEASGRTDIALGSAIFPALKVDAAAQRYAHDELDDASAEVVQSFALKTRTLNVIARQGRVGFVTEGAWGVSALVKDYAATGPAALTPAADSRGLGVFGFQEVSLGGPALQLGGRFDEYRIGSRDSEKFGAGRERVFRALSGSLGLRLPVADGVSAGMSLARSFRAPTVEELFSGGAHAGTGSVELGSPELESERGLSLEGVLRLRKSRWNGEFAAYHNAIDGYVHLAARGDTVIHGVHLPVLAYAQSRAVLRGMDGSLEWAATTALVLGVMGDYLHAQQANGTPLSFMPPPRVGLLTRWDNGTLSLGGDVHREFRQDRVGAAAELPTPAHTVYRLNAGVRFERGGQHHSITLRAENLSNELHREATSRIKDFAPGPGRNLALAYRVHF